ncbi:MAG: hypothetical protein A2297_10285 [Elusimicrobia bacterium RIFOXYB2_FULL_48_7]|nr:MAG: hypothetical protein A2297_10285 [Elusimicrobia bacterium RIFOXYB2_FULL_48_7]
MKISELLEQFNTEKVITPEQYSALTEISENRRFSLHVELQALLYIGVLTIITGIGLTINKYFAQLGHIAIIGSLTALFAGSLWYCFAKCRKGLLLDYILLFACLVYASDIAYIETHFKVLGDFWKNYMLFSSALFAFLAYRFDNRLILSMALTTLAAWFGFKFQDFNVSFREYHRIYAVIYGAMVLAAGIILNKRKIKEHFFDIYLNFGLNFIFIASVSGVFEYKFYSLFFILLAGMVMLTGLYGLHSKSFLYMVYAVLYGYAGISAVLMDFLKGLRSPGVVFYYYIFSSVGILAALLWLSRRFKGTE